MELKKTGLIAESASIRIDVKDYGAVPIKAPMDGKPNGEIFFYFFQSK